jgi:hypothetical protein
MEFTTLELECLTDSGELLFRVLLWSHAKRALSCSCAKSGLDTGGLQVASIRLCLKAYPYLYPYLNYTLQIV